MGKLICVRGHDVSICGRYANGKCAECCRNDASAENIVRMEDPEYRKKRAEYAKNWRNTPRGRAMAKAGSDKWRKSDNGISYRWKKQGILIDGRPFTTVDYDRAYQVQQGRCAGCEKHQSELSKRLIPDHDHANGEFRWLLCNKCNGVLGYVNDDALILEKLAGMMRGRLA